MLYKLTRYYLSRMSPEELQAYDTYMGRHKKAKQALWDLEKEIAKFGKAVERRIEQDKPPLKPAEVGPKEYTYEKWLNAQERMELATIKELAGRGMLSPEQQAQWRRLRTRGHLRRRAAEGKKSPSQRKEGS